MKRDGVPIYPNLYRTFPLLFWCACSQCEKQWVREWGWAAITGPWHGTRGRTRYLCKTCAPSKAIAAEFFLNRRWLKGSPPNPTPPPPVKNTA